MFKWIKTFLLDRGYFKINWVVRKIVWSMFATYVIKLWIGYFGAAPKNSIVGSGLIVFVLAFFKELTESLGQPEPLWYYFKKEGIKDLAPVMIGISVAIVFLIMKMNGL